MNHPAQPVLYHSPGRACGTLPSPNNYLGEERTCVLGKLDGNRLLWLERTAIDVQIDLGTLIEMCRGGQM